MMGGVSHEIALRWLSLDLMVSPDDKSTLVLVMAWCCQATRYYLSQCWPWSMSPDGLTRPPWTYRITRAQWAKQSLSLLFWIQQQIPHSVSLHASLHWLSQLTLLTMMDGHMDNRFHTVYHFMHQRIDCHSWNSWQWWMDISTIDSTVYHFMHHCIDCHSWHSWQWWMDISTMDSTQCIISCINALIVTADTPDNDGWTYRHTVSTTDSNALIVIADTPDNDGWTYRQ